MNVRVRTAPSDAPPYVAGEEIIMAAIAPAPTERQTPFDSLESSHDYVRMLGQAIDDAVCQIEQDIRIATANGANRRVEALRLAAYKLALLRGHFVSSRRLLNDLRTLRRLLLGERELNRKS
jgi:hypothetical protein